MLLRSLTSYELRVAALPTRKVLVTRNLFISSLALNNKEGFHYSLFSRQLHRNRDSCLKSASRTGNLPFG